MELARPVLDWLSRASSRRKKLRKWIAIVVLPYVGILALALLILTPKKETVIYTGAKGGVYYELVTELERHAGFCIESRSTFERRC